MNDIYEQNYLKKNNRDEWKMLIKIELLIFFLLILLFINIIGKRFIFFIFS
jgi:hypothetical protein